MPGQTFGTNWEDSLRYYDEMARMMNRAFESWFSNFAAGRNPMAPGAPGYDYGDMMNIMTRAYESWFSGFTPWRAPIPSGKVSDDYGDVMDFMRRAYLAYMTSAMRSWRRLAELYGHYYQAMTDSVMEISAGTSESEEARRILIDNIRAYLREMVELPGQEARWLQAELEKILADLWPSEDEENKSSHRRRAKIKL